MTGGACVNSSDDPQTRAPEVASHDLADVHDAGDRVVLATADQEEQRAVAPRTPEVVLELDLGRRDDPRGVQPGARADTREELRPIGGSRVPEVDAFGGLDGGAHRSQVFAMAFVKFQP